MKTLIDFVIDASADKVLGEEFQSALEKAETVEELKGFFTKKGYAISEQECIRLIENKAKLSGPSVKAPY